LNRASPFANAVRMSDRHPAAFWETGSKVPLAISLSSLRSFVDAGFTDEAEGDAFVH
jgi:hypothetical protein